MSRTLLLAISVLIVVIMGFAGYGLAYALTHNGSTTVQASPTDTPISSATTTNTSPSGPGTRRSTGTIQSINGQTLVLTLLSGKSLTVTVTAQTSYARRNGAQAALSDLQVGQKIRVEGTFNKQDQTLTADTVQILGG
jgi:Domain of unknown function (DUF5666)